MGRATNKHFDKHGKLFENIGVSLTRMEDAVWRDDEEDLQLMTFTVSCPLKGREDWLVTGRFTTGGRKLVAFHSAATVYEALKGFADRLVNKTLQFKEDNYA